MSATLSRDCVIRIVATITRIDPDGVIVDYMGERFLVPLSALIERVDSHMALLQLDAAIIRPTGQASFLASYAGHALRVHVQQIREASR